MWRTAGMFVILASCVFMYAKTPHFWCLAMKNRTCDDLPMGSLMWVYTRSASVTCFVMYSVMWAKYRGGVAKYRARIAVHDAHSPATDADRRKHATFNAAVVSACALLIPPVNGARLVTMHGQGQSAPVLAFYALMYAQNVATCLLETRFVHLCYVLFTKFVGINRTIGAIGDQIAADRSCPSSRPRSCSVAAPSGPDGHNGGPHRSRQNRDGCYWVRDDDGMYCSRDTGQRLVDAVGQLRIRHRLVREAVDELHDVFAVPVGFSLCNLCIMALYDIYYQLLNVYVHHSDELSNLFVFAWLVQYSFRFSVIVITVHSTMEQAFKSKELLTRVSRIGLDVYTKEELQIFSDQVSSTMEFSICGLFTLNSQLLISAMGVSITYLVILLQLKSNLDNDGS